MCLIDRTLIEVIRVPLSERLTPLCRLCRLCCVRDDSDIEVVVKARGGRDMERFES